MIKVVLKPLFPFLGPDFKLFHRPKIIEELQGKGLTFEKVEAGYSSNLALTTDGQVWTWGSGKCLGVGGGASSNTDSETFLLPTLLEGFEGCPVVDISMGESHCLALLRDCSVYTWGLNTMGQCGLGHNAPVVVPQKVKALEGLPIHQISAGTSHSIAWTALPPNAQQNLKWQKPFCVDVSSETFNIICRSLVEFGLKNHPWSCDEQNDINCEEVSSHYFESAIDRNDFVISIISLLSPHLILATPNNLQSNDNTASNCLEADQRSAEMSQSTIMD